MGLAVGVADERHVLVSNVSLTLDASIALELWRRPVTATASDKASTAMPPLVRAPLRCVDGGGVEKDDAWAVSNTWDYLRDEFGGDEEEEEEEEEDAALASCPHMTSPQDRAQTPQTLGAPSPAGGLRKGGGWRCREREDGVWLEWDGAVMQHGLAVWPGRLMALSLSGHLAPPDAPPGEAHVMVVAAWDVLCRMHEGLDDGEVGGEGGEGGGERGVSACRTVITTSRVRLSSIAREEAQGDGK